MTLRIASCAVACLLMLSPSASAQMTVRERLRDVPAGGDLSLTNSPMHPSMEIPTLLGLADLVVEGVIARTTIGLTRDGRSVATTYDLRVEQVLFTRRSGMPVPGPAISSVRFWHTGGQIDVDGLTVRAVDDTLRPFMMSTRLILFLKSDVSENGAYQILDGPYGTFAIEGGKVKSFLPAGSTLGDLYNGADVATFRAAIQGSNPGLIRR